MRRLTYLLFGLALIHGVFYVSLIPPWQAPDEIAHFEYSRLLADERRLLSLADASPALEQQIIQSLYTYRAWTFVGVAAPDQPPTRLSALPFFGPSRTLGRFSLAYVPYAVAVWPWRAHPVVTQLYIMRLVSVVWGALVVALGFRIAQLVAPAHPAVATGAALFILFLPQHAFIQAVVNDGNLAEAFAVLSLYLLVKMAREGFSLSRLVLSLLCVSAAVLSKATAYFLVPVLLVAGPMLALRHRRLWRERRLWRRLGLALVVAGLLSLAFLPGVLAAPTSGYVRWVIGSNLEALADWGTYLAALNANNRLTNALWGTFQSFWATFGWMALPLPRSVYTYLLAGSLISLVGLVSLGVRFRKQIGPVDASVYGILGLAAVMPLVILVGWFVASPNGLIYYQGRYLFGGLAPLAVGWVGGLMAFAPRPYHPWLLGGLAFALVAFDALSIWAAAVPFFYPPS
jgi:4-amino-4-deoxy-L-arabinose transferase-like glycosyltransferase